MGFVGIIAEFLLVAQGGATHVGHDYALPIPRILLGTDPAKPLILLAQIAFRGLGSRNLESCNCARESGRGPPSPASCRPLTSSTAPFRAFSRFSARVVLALRATMKRGTSDAPGQLASISVAAALFVSRVGELSCPAREAATKVAMRCGARGETQSQAPGRRRASRLRSNPPRRGRRSWSRAAPLSPCGRAMDESVTVPSVWNDVWQLALCRKVTRDVLIV